MKKWILLLCVVLLFSSCAAVMDEAVPSSGPEAESNAAQAAVLQCQGSMPEPELAAFTPGLFMTPQDTVEAYFEQQYLSYTRLVYQDFSSIMDMDQTHNRNTITWLKTLIRRRKLIEEYNLCYVNTQEYSYTINYISASQLEDNRMSVMRNGDVTNDYDMALHFVITGEDGRAYPPFMAVNSQHTILLKQIDGVWKISFHYFPGSIRKYPRDRDLTLPSEENMLSELRKEFAAVQSGNPLQVPEGARAYNASLAVQYAKLFTESKNGRFYNVGDWKGNCANFVSQCVWYGFSNGGVPDVAGKQFMVSGWYAGSGGGSAAWENVESFWGFAAEGNKLYGQILKGASELVPGDVIQTSSSGGERYNHTLIVVDQNTMKLGQNSPGCYVYYSDLVNVQKRFLRPIYLTP